VISTLAGKFINQHISVREEKSETFTFN
jgi:hypothetical protein